jgi:SnoaL-like protein
MPLYASSLFTCISCLLFLFVSCSVIGNKQDSIMADKQQVLHILKEYYKGITNRDTELFYLNSTNDFVLYEQGKVMDNLTFSKLIMSLDPKTKIEYEFTDTEVNLSKNIAHLFYKTTGIITTNNNIEKRQYLESALLIKEKDKWKIKFIHSTKIK